MSRHRRTDNSNSSVPFAVPGVASPPPAAANGASTPNQQWENHWSQSTGAQAHAPNSIVATASFPNLTATTGTLPLDLHPRPAYKAPRRVNSNWMWFSLIAITAIGAGALASRVLLAPRPVLSVPALLTPATGQDSAADTQSIKRRIPPPQSPVQQQKRQQRFYWRGYSSRPDITAGSPPSPYAEALRNNRLVPRRVAPSGRP